MPPRWAILLAYTLSGAAGLLYEVAWARLLTLHLGHTTAAVSTVLAAFMGGLAGGAAAGGRYAPKLDPHAALRTYAVVELAIGVLALLLPRTLDLLRPLLAWAYADGAGGPLFAVARATTSLAVVAVPAGLMGATLPLMVRGFAREAAHAGPDAGLLYAANTLGAAAGAALTSFLILPALGLFRTTLAGIGLNATAALLAVWAARAALPPTPPSGAAARERAKPRRPPGGGGRPRAAGTALAPGIAAGVLAVSGFAALADEVVWTRLAALVMGPTTYAFGLMLSVFIAGLAAGAALGAWGSRQIDPRAALGLALVVSGLGGLLVVGAAGTLPVRVAALVTRPETPFATLLAVEAAGLAALLLPATLAFGASFPLAIAAAANGARPVARVAAVVYAGNTVGAIAGALTSGFLLVPRLGLQRTALAAAALTAVAGFGVFWRAGGRAARRLLALPAAAIVSAYLWVPRWNPALLSSGAYKYGAYLAHADLETALEAGTLLFYAEGAAGTVSVRRSTGTLSLAIDGKVDASNGGDMLTQKLLAHLPLLVHPAPRRVAIVGLGSGVTAGAALVHPVESVEVIEISPEVVRASTWFARENRSALDDPRTRLVVGDARTHFALGRRRYDVIISEPSNPWMAGVAGLFTREFFAHLKARLAPGGIVCQWAHTYDISDHDLRSIVATFLSVFPAGGLWLVGDADVLLVAGDEPVDVLLERMAGAWRRPDVAADLATVGVQSPFALLTQLVAAGPALAAYAGDAAIQTDDRVALEFTAPRAVYTGAGEMNVRRLRALAERTPKPPAVLDAISGATAADWKARGLMLLQAESPGAAYDDLVRAAAADLADLETLRALVRAAAAAGRLDAAGAFLAELAHRPAGRVTARIAASHLFASTGRTREALDTIQAARALAPEDARVLAQQASILADLGDAQRLAPVVQDLEARAPEDPETLYYRATLALLAGEPARAREIAEALVRRAPDHARGLNLLGAAYASVGRQEEARRAFREAIEKNPKDATAYVNLGSLELEAANPRAAAGYFAEALVLEPTSETARDGLARAFELAGDHARASRVRRETRRSIAKRNPRQPDSLFAVA